MQRHRLRLNHGRNDVYHSLAWYASPEAVEAAIAEIKDDLDQKGFAVFICFEECCMTEACSILLVEAEKEYYTFSVSTNPCGEEIDDG